MKLRNHQFSIQPPTSEISKQDFINGSYPRIFEGSEYVHPWYDYTKVALVEYYGDNFLQLNRPNPPSKEAIERAKFVDKTYEWKGRTNRIRSRN